MSLIEKVLNECKKIPYDKALHIVFSAVISRVLRLCGMPLWLRLLVFTLIVGGKELYDWASKKGTPEWRDMLANYIGFAIGA